ncbi:MAG TPA: mycofactocin-associated electron transfer flavoprotein alpha subunit [Acidimicrobiales bacterium]|nr:mycofactocin-associated electron transfer flavoprotein alpha subunit [Acidimicrobiales bacterium]
MIALIPVREGELPLGADEAVSEAGGDVVLVGQGTDRAAAAIGVGHRRVRTAEAGPFAPGAWAAALAPLLADVDVVILPASPDGRDLGPRLAAATGRPFVAGALTVAPDRLVVTRLGSRLLADVELAGPAIVTLQPGVGAVAPALTGLGGPAPEPLPLHLEDAEAVEDAEVLEVQPADPRTVDLAEARRIVAGGLGLGSAAAFALLEEVSAAVGASAGATRVVTDRGWAPFARQIGTTGVTVRPELYLAFGISGAVQHLAGIVSPEHVIAVNTDPTCPMMAMAHLAIVADAPAVLEALARRLLAGPPAADATTGTADAAAGRGGAGGVQVGTTTGTGRG